MHVEHVTQQISVALRLLTHSGGDRFKSRPARLNSEISCGFPQFLQENAGTAA
jgi:hypothetical protein